MEEEEEEEEEEKVLVFQVQMLPLLPFHCSPGNIQPNPFPANLTRFRLS